MRLPSKPSLDMPNSSFTLRSRVELNTGPSLQTRYLPIMQLPHMPMPHRMRRSRLASMGTLCFSVRLKTSRIMRSGPQA